MLASELIAALQEQMFLYGDREVFYSDSENGDLEVESLRAQVFVKGDWRGASPTDRSDRTLRVVDGRYPPTSYEIKVDDVTPDHVVQFII